MKLRRTTLTAALAVTGVVVGMTTAHADSNQPPPVSYQAKLVGESVVTALENGSFALQDADVPGRRERTCCREAGRGAASADTQMISRFALIPKSVGAIGEHQ
ncbi:hypothetical protein [Nocardia sp. NPDC019255]|uniref:hypothetical protein n=1 Tax=Nocardia sp. NPDC019255 TaxID=3154591 RepID=UPI0033C457CB